MHHQCCNTNHHQLWLGVYCLTQVKCDVSHTTGVGTAQPQLIARTVPTLPKNMSHSSSALNTIQAVQNPNTALCMSPRLAANSLHQTKPCGCSTKAVVRPSHSITPLTHSSHHTKGATQQPSMYGPLLQQQGAVDTLCHATLAAYHSHLPAFPQTALQAIHSDCDLTQTALPALPAQAQVAQQLHSTSS